MNKRLVRSKAKRQIAGVCGGLSDFFGVDVGSIRLLYIFATLFTAFSGLIIYIALALLLPEE
ncbi:PspC domain-containing protein [Porphyromonas cangingivalis]|uniref:PspC domain-containing protein n=1 Tax=Porphyromonas cangingivalis TaxID=36874 RepID=UPI0024311C9B|nr:PspC domain-containing protein [Porphyromonas cangingivalis]